MHHFHPPSHIELPLPDGAHLLAAGVVENCIFGESLPHVVVRRGSALLIGCFDEDVSSFKTLVEVDLAEAFLDNCANPRDAIQDCWLADGPLFVAQRDGKFATVSNSVCQRSDSFKITDHTRERFWNASMLNLEGICDTGMIRALCFGDLKAFAEPELLLCIQLSHPIDFDATAQRVRAEWDFVTLPLGSLAFSNSGNTIYHNYSPNSSWQQIPLENGIRACNQLFSRDICPDLISYIEIVPMDPVTTVSSLHTSPCDIENGEIMHDIAVGFWDGKIVKYRLGNAVAKCELEYPPISLHFAIVAGGQGVLLAVLDGKQNEVVALCAETLKILREWTGVQDVVVNDFQMVGHDQLLLLSSLPEGKVQSTSLSDNFSMSMQLTDMEKSFSSGLQPPAQPELPGAASEAHKIHSLKAISQCLKSRVEAGLAQMKQLEQQMETKAELVQSSCKLLQDMVVKHESSAAPPDVGPNEKLGSRRGFVQASVRQHGMCGRTWFLLVDVQNIAQEGIILHELSLSLTTVRGQISSSSSVVKSLSTTEEKNHLVAAASVMNLPNVSSLPTIHIMVNLKVSKGNSGHSLHLLPAIHTQEVREGRYWMHTAWVGQVQIDGIHITGCLEPASVPLEFREVASTHTFIIQTSSEEQIMQVVDAMKLILNMEERKNSDDMQFRLQKGRRHELVAKHSLLWADTTITSSGKIHMVTMRAEDTKHLSVLKACLMTKLESDILLP